MAEIKTETDIQIRFADVDILGHVNNVNLQHFFDLGKSDYLSTVLGLGLVWKEEGLITAATNTSYLAQTRPEEKIYVETQVEKIGTKSITVFQRIIARGSGEVKAESRTVLVAFDFKAQESIEIPADWREKTGV